MKSKSHAKKCEELGVSPLPTAEDMMEDAASRNGTRLLTVPGDSDSEDESDGDDQSDGSDTEDIKARLPQEQEAARGLLSLSMTPPIIMSSAIETYRSVPQTIDRLGEDLSVKCQARPEFPVQKISFEFPRPEQYYSNPSIVKAPIADVANEADTDSDVPMDLTKPRSSNDISSAPAVVYSQIMQTAGLISSLVSITDKIPGICVGGLVVGSGLSENALLQQYLTERAMYETKMKQHQQKREYQVAQSETEDVGLQQHPYTGDAVTRPADKNTHLDVKNHILRFSENEVSIGVPLDTKPELLTSSMDTLADIAANSTKLNTDLVTNDRNTTAQFVASEYLKMATQRNTLKSDREDGESSSDQEIVNDAGRKRTDSVSDVIPRTVVVVKDPQKMNTEFVNVTSAPPCRVPPPTDDGRSFCELCKKTFQKPSQLKLHMNIHYLERKFRCEPCGVSFRNQGHLQKHERSLSHNNKVSMTSTFGVPTTVNPRPFNCTDCRVAFRIHGHLAKHLRSKMHVLRLECLCKIPFGTYAEIERAGINLTAIDTKDCDTFLASLKSLARDLPELGASADHMQKVAASGEKSDNEGSEHEMINGYAGAGGGDPMSGNENGDRSKLDENKTGLVLKRKFGTLLAVNDTDDELLEQDGPGVLVGSEGDALNRDLIGGNGGDPNQQRTKEFERAANLASSEKRIKVN